MTCSNEHVKIFAVGTRRESSGTSLC
ncbi:hypothetical protein CJF31_00007087 [Rutstroemia sp. NJR-2017a BVV2]|nr:hypothetical protein CJF31_00007087 [Rutstroemia sp. NJR-2017a BVV2]